jgi:hypothetical protein
MKNSVNCILIGLASFDIVLITTSILMFGMPSIYTYSIVMGWVVLSVSNLVFSLFAVSDPELLFFMKMQPSSGTNAGTELFIHSDRNS